MISMASSSVDTGSPPHLPTESVLPCSGFFSWLMRHPTFRLFCRGIFMRLGVKIIESKIHKSISSRFDFKKLVTAR